MSVRVEGIQDAVQAFRDMPGPIREAIAEKVANAAAIIESEAIGRVPIDEGDLKRDIQTKLSPRGMAAVVGNDEVIYARWVELGTLRMNAQPYLYPAFRWGARYFRKEMRSLGDEIGAKVRGRTRRSRRPR